MSKLNSCLNCETPLNGEFCSNCGQSSSGINHFFLTLVNEAFEDVFRRNSRIWKTFIYLLFRPGLLSKEYCKGRRVSYVRPVKLYVFTSILFFVTVSAINLYTEVSSFDPTASSSSSQQDGESPEAILKIDLDEGGDEESSEWTQSDEDQLDEFIDSLSIDSESNFFKLVGVKFKSAIEKIKLDPSQIEPMLLDVAPPVIFCFLPLFALLLKLNYLTKRIYYTEHLILALHNQSFLFLILTLNAIVSFSLQQFSIANAVLGSAMILWIPVYMWLSMKNVYLQGKLITTSKFILLGLSYFALVVFGIVLCFIFGVMTL